MWLVGRRISGATAAAVIGRFVDPRSRIRRAMVVPSSNGRSRGRLGVALGGVAGLRRTLGPQIFFLLLLTPRPGWYNDAVVGPFASPAHSVVAASGATLVKLICAVMATGFSVPDRP